jgi:hypothetical protein
VNCWLCGGWGSVDKRDTGEKSWRDGPVGKIENPVYVLTMAPGTFEGELIECPVCRGSGKS